MDSVTVFLTLFAVAYAAKDTPDSCFGQADLENLVKCWSGFIPQEASFTDGDFQTSLPTDQQRGDWQQLIGQLLDSDGSCQNIQVPRSIADLYQIKVFEDKTNNAKFCVLYEKSLTISGDRFTKAWGIFVVPLNQNWSRINLHYSAAHPFTDGPVHQQATAIFLRTNGRSLLITGARRSSSAVDSECQPGNYRTDAAHDTRMMFHSALIATKKWQFQASQTKNCKPTNCAFLQFHGKANNSCVNDTIFISAGYSGSSAIYDNPNLPANRLRTAWISNAPAEWTAHTAAESTCNLSGTTNIFGRVLNGVDVGKECGTPAPKGAQGFFIHVEQAMVARESGAYDVWAKSIKSAFTPTRG